VPVIPEGVGLVNPRNAVCWSFFVVLRRGVGATPVGARCSVRRSRSGASPVGVGVADGVRGSIAGGPAGRHGPRWGCRCHPFAPRWGAWSAATGAAGRGHSPEGDRRARRCRVRGS